MIRAVKIVAALAVCLAVANATGPFPRDRGLVYSYYGDVKAGIIEPAAYASQYSISGEFNVEPIESDRDDLSFFMVALVNVRTGLHNGIAEHYEPTKASRSLPEPAQILEHPFLIAYQENGQLAGVRISSDEPRWSRNMKMAMASMLQLDMPSLNLESPIKHHSFMSKENTIHGDCWTSYDVHPTEDTDELIITKFGSPRNCTNYNIFTFNNAEVEACDLPPERPVNMASRRVFKVKKDHQNILIKSLIAHGGVNYFPWKGRSEAHYVLNNATFVLLDKKPPAGFRLSFLKNLLKIEDISYLKPEGSYSEGSGIDVTQGRHVVSDPDILISKAKEMLKEAADYLEEDHLEAKEPDFKHGQTINRLVRTMSFMQVSDLRQLFSDVKSTDGSVKTIFLETLPYVGTPAAVEVINELIRLEESDVDRLFAMQMLAKLPLSVRNPTPETALLLDPFRTSGLSYNVRAAAIPSFGSLLFRAFKNTPKSEQDSILQEQIEMFYNQLVNNEYNEKVAALAGLRNLQVGGIFERLAPLIRGQMELKQFPDASLMTNLRMHAIWAVEKSIPSYQAAHDLLWPIMADSNLPLKLRIAAYDVLIRQAPSMTNILHIYWFMVYEKNEHLYNYHHTTIKGLANSVNPCDMHLKELATKILRFTRIHTPVSYRLSSSFMVNAMDEIYGHGDQVSLSYTLNENTGFPDVLNIESSEIAGRKRVTLWKIQLILQNFNHYTSPLTAFIRFGRVPVANDDVVRILEEAGRNSTMGELLIDAVISFRGRVVFANHYRGRTIIGLFDDLAPLVKIHRNTAEFMRKFVSYDAMYEQHVVSEMGLPVLLESKIPMVQSIFGMEQRDYILGSVVEFGYKAWRHGDYSMSIYNPLLDVWHSIKRATATDVQFFYEFTNGRTFMPAASETIIPILSSKKDFKQGLITHAKDCTTISEGDDGALKRSCPTCEYHETVTKGIAAKRNHEDVNDVKDMGLQFSTSVFDCETGLTPVVIDKEFFRSLYKERKNSWGYDWSAELLALSQTFKNLIISPRMGSCGFMYKVEPSSKYPTSHLKLSLKVNTEDVDDNQKTPHILSATKFSLRGSLKAIAVNEKEPICAWHVNMDLDMSREHKQNTMSLQMSRSTPGEKNLVICVDAQKTYPSLPDDPLKLGVTKDETYSKLTVAMGKADTTECPSDQTLITVGVKGELSEEQKRKFIQESISGDCKADMDKSMYKNSEGLVPRTEKCLDHAIRFTTLRKYTINVTHENVPECITSALQSYEDEIKALLYPHLMYTSEHTDLGTMRMTIKFPMNLDSMNMSVATPDQGWDIVGAEVSEKSWLGMERDPPRHQGFGPDPDKHLWISPLDNTRFPFTFITNYRSNAIRLCSLYPEVVLTSDGGEISHSMSDEWTLATGDKYSQSFAVFVKSVNNIMGLKLFFGEHLVEFSPNRNDYSIKINNEDFAVNELINGTFVPRDQWPWVFKLTNYGGITAVQINDVPITIFQSLNSVTVMIDRKLQGNIAGLCGNLNGKYKNQLPEIYQIP
uniref:Vit-3 protein n=2 Tax=Fopius arisanus TaxID=64838 RepID=A0A0C9QRH7_9HYME